jgi:hypothetical protein
MMTLPKRLSIPTDSRVKDRGLRPTDTGIVPRFMDRWAVDQQIFAERRSGYGGLSILLDNSGSMLLREKEIENLMMEFPGCRIMRYQGAPDGSGILQYLCENGRRIARGTIKHVGSCNNVDGPALETLCRQRGVKIWISDGCITGAKDGHGDAGSSKEMHAHVERLKKQNQIQQFETIDKAVEWLRKSGRRMGGPIKMGAK